MVYNTLDFIINDITGKDKKAKIAVPNNLFLDIKNIQEIENVKQRSFSFAYLVMNSFLTKYASYWDYEQQKLVTKADIKELLGYNRLAKTVNSLIKDRGLLEQYDLIKNSKDIPIYYNLNNRNWELLFIGDADQDIQEAFVQTKHKEYARYKASIPSFLLGDERGNETLNDPYLTFTISFETFNYLVLNKNISLTEFYVYCFILSQSYREDDYSADQSAIAGQIGMSVDRVNKTLNKLKNLGYIDILDRGFEVEEGILKRKNRGYKIK